MGVGRTNLFPRLLFPDCQAIIFPLTIERNGEDARFMDMFLENKRFYRGNFHCHTTLSDGWLTPEKVKALYRKMGYDFLVVSDHRLLSPQASMEDGLLVMPGMEMDFTLPGEALHIVGFGMSEAFRNSRGWLLGPQQCIDTMRRYGGRAILAHPHWSMNTLATLSALRNLTAAEIYNTVSGIPWNGARADSSAILDVAAVHGTLFNLVAADDSHEYNGEAGRSYTMVQAEALTQEAIIAAMDAGRFYASQGPRFEQITLEGDQVIVRCSPVQTVVFYSNEIWATERCQTGKDMTRAVYHLAEHHTESFLRVQLIDDQGNNAWSSPIRL